MRGAGCAGGLVIKDPYRGLRSQAGAAKPDIAGGAAGAGSHPGIEAVPVAGRQGHGSDQVCARGERKREGNNCGNGKDQSMTHDCSLGRTRPGSPFWVPGNLCACLRYPLSIHPHSSPVTGFLSASRRVFWITCRSNGCQGHTASVRLPGRSRFRKRLRPLRIASLGVRPPLPDRGPRHACEALHLSVVDSWSGLCWNRVLPYLAGRYAQ